MECLKVKNITYTYPLSDKPTIKNISFNLKKGKFYSILGANGSGKTTLCNILRGFIPNLLGGELQGEVVLYDKNINEYDAGELALKIGYIFQNPFNQITGARENVYEEIAYGLENFGIPVDKIKQKVNSIMELTNISHLKDKNPFELSGGQQQRVALASILVLDPDIFIIDEPTSQLDPKESQRVFEIISKLKDMGKTIILVEHKIELIAQYSDEILVLEDGKLIIFDNKYNAFLNPNINKQKIAVPKCINIINQLKNKGLNIKENIITIDELAKELKKLGKIL